MGLHSGHRNGSTSEMRGGGATIITGSFYANSGGKVFFLGRGILLTDNDSWDEGRAGYIAWQGCLYSNDNSGRRGAMLRL